MSEIEKEFKSGLSTITVDKLKINIRARDPHSLRRIISEIKEITKGEIININEPSNEAIVSVSNASQANTAINLAKKINYCFYIRASKDGLTIEEFECPPCKEGAITKLPETYFMLSDGRVIEKRGENTYLVYVCKIRK